MTTVQSLIQNLHLQPHPEGGYYGETYRSNTIISKPALPNGFGGDRVFSTAIYYLLQAGDFSAFHRIKSDELWHFYEGVGLHIYTLHAGRAKLLKLGSPLNEGYAYQQLVPAGTWFAAQPAAEHGFTLAGCTVSPGFDFSDFEMAKRDDLLKEFPEQAEWILKLTRA